MKKFHFTTSVSSSFVERFNLESMVREKQRAGILAVLSATGLVFTTTILTSYRLFLFPNDDTPIVMAVLLSFLAVYELMLWKFLTFRLAHKKGFPDIAKFGNAFVEITLPSLGLYIISHNYQPPIVSLLTPLALVYFLFIILSTLRLNFALSLFTGVVAAVQYVLLSYIFLSYPKDPHLETIFQMQFIYISKGMILLMSGLVAGYVAQQIQQSILKSIETMAHQNQIINLFGQQISREVVDEMLHQNGTLQSRLMLVSVMFIDIRRFTRYAEKKSPQEVVEYQNAFFSIIIDIVTRHHGIINQFLGDGCMITFGAPVALANPCINSVRCGLEIIRQVNRQVAAGNLPPTDVGIGVHVGEAVTGNIGTDIRQQYSITGNVVILASRIEQLNKELNSQMLISEEVLSSLEGTTLYEYGSQPLNAEPIGLVRIKGREEEIYIFKLA